MFKELIYRFMCIGSKSSKERFESLGLHCHCKFFRQYLLPCRYIFHLDTELKVLTTSQREIYLMMFAECGIEVYETVSTVWIKGDNRNSRHNAERTSSMTRAHV